MADGESPLPQSLTVSAQEKLKQFVARIEKVEADQKEQADDKKEIYAEAKSLGYDTKAIRAIVRLRKQDRQERETQEQLLDLYLHAIGELAA